MELDAVFLTLTVEIQVIFSIGCSTMLTVGIRTIEWNIVSTIPCRLGEEKSYMR